MWQYYREQESKLKKRSRSWQNEHYESVIEGATEMSRELEDRTYLKKLLEGVFRMFKLFDNWVIYYLTRNIMRYRNL